MHPQEGKFAVLANAANGKSNNGRRLSQQLLAEFEAGHPAPLAVHVHSGDDAALVAATYLPSQDGGSAKLCVIDSDLAFSSAFGDADEDGVANDSDENVVRFASSFFFSFFPLYIRVALISSLPLLR